MSKNTLDLEMMCHCSASMADYDGVCCCGKWNGDRLAELNAPVTSELGDLHSLTQHLIDTTESMGVSAEAIENLSSALLRELLRTSEAIKATGDSRALVPLRRVYRLVLHLQSQLGVRTKRNKDLEKPEGLGPDGEVAYNVVMSVLKEYNLSQTGGCRAFYSPTEWKDRGESYCCDSLLVVVYDGGDVREAVDPYDRNLEVADELQRRLNAKGMFIENGTHWFSGVYLSETGRFLGPSK